MGKILCNTVKTLIQNKFTKTAEQPRDIQGT